MAEDPMADLPPYPKEKDSEEDLPPGKSYSKKEGPMADKQSPKTFQLAKVKEEDLMESPPPTKKRKSFYSSSRGKIPSKLYIPAEEVVDLLLPIAERWRWFGYNIGLNESELDDIQQIGFSSNQEMLRYLIMEYQDLLFRNMYVVPGALLSLGEYDLANEMEELFLKEGYLPASQKKLLPAKNDTKAIKLEFSNLLLATTNLLKQKSPREVANMLSCFDARFSVLTQDCKDIDDVIAMMIDNVTFVDYDLLQYLAFAMNDLTLNSNINNYATAYEKYWKKRLCNTTTLKTCFKVDKEAYILPYDSRTISQLKLQLQNFFPIKRDITLEFHEGVQKVSSEATKESESSKLSENSDIGNIEVLKEFQVRLTNSAKVFEWKDYGLKLSVPSLSLHASIYSCTLTIKVSFSGLYQFPAHTELVSPVFWLSCEPSYKFTRPLRLEIQHCAPLENSHRLFMAKASSTPKDLAHTFTVLPGGIFSEHSTYGVIELDSFSGVGVVQERSDKRRYWSSVFYMGPPNSRDIHFAVTWDTNAHITMTEKSYNERKAVPGPKQSLMFKGNAIELDIPMEGIQTEEWKLRLATPSKITKEEVDEYRRRNSKALPHCELLACWNKDIRQANPFRYTVNILGTVKDNFFLININPDVAINETEDKALDTQNKLGLRHLFHISECLKELTRDDIIGVGLALGLLYPNLTKMQMLPQDMIQAWLQQKDGATSQPTTERLILALEKSNLMGTAETVKQTFM